MGLPSRRRRRVNHSVVTTDLEKLRVPSDGGKYLKEEVKKSTLRLKSCKNGRWVKDVAPRHDPRYFMPSTTDYFTPRGVNLQTQYAQFTP